MQDSGEAGAGQQGRTTAAAAAGGGRRRRVPRWAESRATAAREEKCERERMGKKEDAAGFLFRDCDGPVATRRNSFN